MTPKQTPLWPVPSFIRPPDSAPHADGSDTSEAAAASIQPHLNALQAKILEVLANYRAYGAASGLICQHVEDITGMDHQTVSPRILELRRKGLIRDSGYRRKTRSGRKAVVWRIVK